MQALRPNSLRTLVPALLKSSLRPAAARPLSMAATADGMDEPTVLNGRELSKQIREKIRHEVKTLKEKTGSAPHLAIVTVGERPPSEALRRKLFASGPGEGSWWDLGKVDGAKEVGFDVTHVRLPAHSDTAAVNKELARLSRSPSVNGVMLELPLPSHLTAHRQELWAAIDPEKDVDGMTLHNAGRLFDLATGIKEAQDTPIAVNLPTTPLGALEYVKACGVNIKAGSNVVVIGRSKLVGLPLVLLMLARNATVTITHSHTPEAKLIELCRDADVIVATAGIPGMVKPEWVKKGAVVMNVGTTFVPEKKELQPDVDRRVQQVASFVSPVPYFDPSTGRLTPSGGGPMTLPVLLHSTLVHAQRQAKAKAAKAGKGARADTPSLSSSELKAAGLEAKGWTVAADGKSLAKTWVVSDFSEAVRLINDMKGVAEKENHHPTLHLTDYRRLNVELFTGLPCGQEGSGGGRRVTSFDVKLAKAFDDLVYAPHQA